MLMADSDLASLKRLLLEVAPQALEGETEERYRAPLVQVRCSQGTGQMKDRSLVSSHPSSASWVRGGREAGVEDINLNPPLHPIATINPKFAMNSCLNV